MDSHYRQPQQLRTPARWRCAPIPDGFGERATSPATGTVELPVRLYWSGRNKTADLATPEGRYHVYRCVLDYGTADDVETYIDPVLLVKMWPDRLWSQAVRETWQPWIDSQARCR